MKTLMILAAIWSWSFQDTVDLEQRGYDKYIAWGYVCEIRVEEGKSCEGVLMPAVEWFNDPRYNGYYEEDSIIHINETLEAGVPRQATMVHEFFHYMDYEVDGGFNDSVKSICKSEFGSFTRTDKFLTKVGREDLHRSGTWVRSYWHCQPYYDPEWELWAWLNSYLGTKFK